MTIKNNFGVIDTGVEGVTGYQLPVPTLNYEKDFAVLDNTKANTVKLVNTTTKVDQEETLRFSISKVADIYKKSNIPNEYHEPIKTGFSLLSQVTDVSKITDASGNSHYGPISCHIVITGPMSAYLDTQDLEAALQRAVAGFYENGACRIPKMIKGAIMPKGL